MGKTYIDIVKYVVEANFEVSGMVDKPDIIGAIFGQTEGLLGGDLDLRELQKSGKIGRIEIESATVGSKTHGKLFLPSSLGRVETCILGAAIESVDRVGPFDTHFKVNKVEDTRSEKRNKIVGRAKDLLKNLLTTEIPDSRELSEMVEADVKLSTITTYGKDALPAGPDIDEGEDVILVEGRADVINLLRNDINNCIAVGGASGTIPKTIIDVCRAKEVTLFLDGDRGGDMILKSLMSVADVDFVARAPDGKEVEELTRKEITKALRSRVPVDQALGRNRPPTREPTREIPQERRDAPGFGSMPPQREFREQRFQGAPPQQQRPMEGSRFPSERPVERPMPSPQREPERGLERDSILSPSAIAMQMGNRPQQREEQRPAQQMSRPESPASAQPPMEKKEAKPEESAKYEKVISELKNTLRGRLYDSSGNVISEVPIRELIQAVEESKGAHAIVFDGIITQRLVELANRQGIKQIYGIRTSQLTRKFDDMHLYTAEQGKL
jgi:DNA primase